ncbi:hypothetical protein AAOE16_03070 [Ekhidna sp. MALMAid0563]|uniref:hypothetical protein n=1 Tax=Ekhidna sp. MALMAid0563 TaxID=3143937 RepID=UPI0032E04AE6
MSKHKWKFHWCMLIILVGLFGFIAFKFEDQTWISNTLQTLGTIIGVYLTIIIFLQSKAESDIQFQEHISALQELNAKQIEALYGATEKQVDAIQKNTLEEISAFEKQIGEVTQQLANNSVLLAEILGRELEKAIEIHEHTVRREEKRFQNLSEWKLLRTEEEKQNQLANQWQQLEKVRQGYEYLRGKYFELRKFLGYNDQSMLER